MTLIKTTRVKAARKSNKPMKLGKVYLQCDFCQKRFVCRENTKYRVLKQDLHFCSKKCSSKSLSNGGKLRLKTENTMIEKYGKAYFCDTDTFKEQQKEFLLENYGVTNRLQIPENIEKIKQTNLERYGRETYAGSEDHQSKIDHKEIAQKAWATKIKNGTCSKSGPEDFLFDLLVENFGIENVQRQIPMIRQWIDLYVIPLGLYIQVDGVYWHGLNRDIEIIKKQATRQDKKIYKQILRDEKLNNYMKESKMKLFRITDTQIKTWSEEDIMFSILECVVEEMVK
jgi:hypothetical protein